MILSKRLTMSADMVAKGSLLADVGCDHAHVPIYLVKKGICPSVIAMDVRVGPLAHAKENILRYHCEDRITTRLSDGLEALKPGECDTILIAGMGGGLTVRILTNGMECVKAAQEIILQPQSERGAVRRFLYANGFHIIEEEMCFEDGKYYNSIHAAANDRKKQQEMSKLTDCEYEYGKILLDGKHPVLYDYLREEYRKALLVKENLEQNNTENTRERLPGFLQELSVLEQALSKFSKVPPA